MVFRFNFECDVLSDQCSTELTVKKGQIHLHVKNKFSCIENYLKRLIRQFFSCSTIIYADINIWEWGMCPFMIF